MWKFIAGIFIVWRGTLELVARLTDSLVPFRLGYLGEVPWANFDGIHYLGIAERGYYQFEQAFFPLYPLLIRHLGWLLGDNYLWAGLLISNLSLVLSLFVFYKLLKRGGFAERTIKWSIVFLLFSPTSFYFGAVYTESLFLLLTLLSFYLLQKINPAKARIFLYLLTAGLASATRLVGAFLLAPLGLFTYMGYLWKVYGDPLLFIHAQPAFGANRSGGEIVFLPQVLWRYLKIFATVPFTAYDFWIAALEVGFLLGTMYLLWLAYKRGLPKSWILFSLAVAAAPTLTGTLSSIPRYILAAFPIYIVMGQRKGKVRIILFLISYLLLLLLTTLFTHGFWVS